MLVTVTTPSVEEKIRELCARAISANESDWEPILSELNSLIHNHVIQARTRVADILLRRADSV